MNMQRPQMEVASLTQFLSLVNYPRVVSGLNGGLLKKRHSYPNPQNLCTLYDKIINVALKWHKMSLR